MKIILYITLSITLIILLYILIFYKYIIQQSRFNLYIGKPRSGKTTLMAKKAVRFMKKYRGKYPVYSNVDINLPGVRIFDPNDISTKYHFEPGCLILIDEPNNYWDNRSFKNKDYNNQAIMWFRLYGHERIKEISLFTQTFDIDRKLRRLCGNIYVVKKIAGTLSVAKLVDKDIDIKENAMDSESQIVDVLSFAPFFIPGSRIWTFIPRWSKFFNSFYLPSGEPIPYQEVK